MLVEKIGNKQCLRCSNEAYNAVREHLVIRVEDTQGSFLVGVIVKHAQTCLTAPCRRHEAT